MKAVRNLPSILRFALTTSFILVFISTSTSADKNANVVNGINIDALLKKMSLKEKIGQLYMADTSDAEEGVASIPQQLKEDIRQGKVGTIININDGDIANELQRIAIEESPLKIPLVAARDVIHGYKTIFPIPLGQAATWHPELVEFGSRIAAEEATADGIRWTFAPMIDVSRDPRWGRIAESFGEDPYLHYVFTKASIDGFQGDDLSDPTSLAACAKHFVGYSAAEGGRDYNTTYIPEPLLHNVYISPFKAAIQAKSATVMAAFNDLNGIPASASTYLLEDTLRQELGFDGIVVSDWGSVEELVMHGYASTEKKAAEYAIKAGIDIEMVSEMYLNHMESLVKSGDVPIANINDKVRRILRWKAQLGLFNSPYADTSRKKNILNDTNLAAAKKTALESLVLLKNNKDILPLSFDQRVALIGPMADAAFDQMGTWSLDGEKENSITVVSAFKAQFEKKDKTKNLRYSPGTPYSRSFSQEHFKASIKAAKKADVIVMIAGEEASLSGEAHSRADLSLPGAQEDLIKALKDTGKPLVVVLMSGRPNTLERIIDDIDALIMAWHPGTMGGPAIADVIFGEHNPSGKLPITWPRTTGQIPIYYNYKNTGRPAHSRPFTYMKDFPLEAHQHTLGHATNYIDYGFEPQFHFGFGLHYTTVKYGEAKIHKKTFKQNEDIEILSSLKNIGDRPVVEIAQLYVRDVFGSVTRPIKELKQFQRIELQPGEEKLVSFTLKAEDLKFYNSDVDFVFEPGRFHVWVAPHSNTKDYVEFDIL